MTGFKLTCSNRFQFFRTRVAQAFATRLQDVEQVFLAELVEIINEGLGTDLLFGTKEVAQACKVMEDEEQLMLSEGIVYKI